MNNQEEDWQQACLRQIGDKYIADQCKIIWKRNGWCYMQRRNVDHEDKRFYEHLAVSCGCATNPVRLITTTWANKPISLEDFDMAVRG